MDKQEAEKILARIEQASWIEGDIHAVCLLDVERILFSFVSEDERDPKK